MKMTESLPSFRYHPQPIASGSIAASDNECVCCGLARGYIYTGPVYGEDDHDGDICPWCIADGSANRKLGVEFTDAAGVGGYGVWPDVPAAVTEEIALRTPGFSGWQQERWFTCCGDGGAFIGRAGYKELLALGANAIEAIRIESELEDEEWEDYFQGLDKDDQPTAYLFRCLHCERIGGYSDFT